MKIGIFAQCCIVRSVRKYLYFNNFWNEERYQQHRIFPTPETETENWLIIVSDKGWAGHGQC